MFNAMNDAPEDAKLQEGLGGESPRLIAIEIVVSERVEVCIASKEATLVVGELQSAVSQMSIPSREKETSALARRLRRYALGAGERIDVKPFSGPRAQ